MVSEDRAKRTRKLFADGPLVGSPEQIVGRLREAGRIGVTYVIGYFVDAALNPDSVGLFAREIIAAL